MQIQKRKDLAPKEMNLPANDDEKKKMGTFYYDPIILPARHPGLIDWVESVAYLGLLFIAAFLCLQQLRGRVLVPAEYPPS
jgi:hypothetical protein